MALSAGGFPEPLQQAAEAPSVLRYLYGYRVGALCKAQTPTKRFFFEKPQYSDVKTSHLQPTVICLEILIHT